MLFFLHTILLLFDSLYWIQQFQSKERETEKEREKFIKIIKDKVHRYTKIILNGSMDKHFETPRKRIYHEKNSTNPVKFINKETIGAI